MAVRLKANIGYMPIVEEVSRKFVPRKETCSAGGGVGPVIVESSGWMGGAVRKSNRAGLGACTRNFLVIRANARSTEPSTTELYARARFTEAVKGVNYINTDLSQIARIQALWVAAKDDKTKQMNGVIALGYTMRGWMIAVQYAGLKVDPEYNANQFPTHFDA